MKLTQALKMAMYSIWNNKLRSFLTMLGIIIGVLSVSLLVSIVQGSTREVIEEIEGLGSNKLVVLITSQEPYYIDEHDLRDLEKDDRIDRISYYTEAGDETRAAGQISDTSIMGISPTYLEMENLSLAKGRGISELDNQMRAHVAVIGEHVAIDLFGHNDVLGERIDTLGRSFIVVGVLREKPATYNATPSQTVYLPYATASRLMGGGNIRSFDAATDQIDQIDDTRAAIDEFLGRRIKPNTAFENDPGYMVFSMGDILEALESVIATLTLMLGGIAGISLLVGGIGIMNIMLVSVTERTREIGIRKAIGAKKRDIMIQFLIEAVTLSVLGGLVGMLTGLGLLQIIAIIMAIPMSLSIGVAALAMIFSLAIGVIFGSYPAWKAAKLHPIDALRYE